MPNIKQEEKSDRTPSRTTAYPRTTAPEAPANRRRPAVETEAPPAASGLVICARSRMIGGVIVSHGQLGEAMINTVEMIVGHVENLIAVSIDVMTEVESSREQIKHAIKTVNHGAGVIIFTDMFGG
ncbi:hypothetical protein GF339_18985, partial [candidate division KSB3 bacterium]|nr:hypothetical protein [candidate division KSB3 bacterium]MBD3326677.1 hypothetical protein [candidate division KSB3 bacterium]